MKATAERFFSQSERKLGGDLSSQSGTKADPIQLAIEVGCAVAMAQLDELEAQSARLAMLVDRGQITKQRAVDILHGAAIASNLMHVHGPDHVQEIIASGFGRRA